MSKGTAYEPTITVGMTYDAVVPPIVLAYSKPLNPKISVSGVQTITPPVVN